MAIFHHQIPVGERQSPGLRVGQPADTRVNLPVSSAGGIEEIRVGVLWLEVSISVLIVETFNFPYLLHRLIIDMRFPQTSPLRLPVSKVPDEIDGVEVALHLVCLGLAEPPHGEVHLCWEVAESAVTLGTAPVSPESVLSPDTILQRATVGLARLPGSLPGDRVLAVGVPPLV